MQAEMHSSMPAPSFGPAPTTWRQNLESLRDQWWCFLLLGVSLIVLGLIALSCSFFTSIFTVVMFGMVLLLAGIGQLVSAFWAGRWEGFAVHMLIGVLYGVTGLLIVDAPLESAVSLTLLLAAMFFVSGVFRISSALAMRFNGWGWTLLNGVVSLLLGVMIYRQWPATGEWVIGLFVGVDLLFAGISWMMLSLSLRTMPQPAETSRG